MASRMDVLQIRIETTKAAIEQVEKSIKWNEENIAYTGEEKRMYMWGMGNALAVLRGVEIAYSQSLDIEKKIEEEWGEV